jgi:two-component sensor histidine kinase
MPLCEELHERQVTGRNLEAVLSAEHQSNDVRLDNARKAPLILISQDPEPIELRKHLLEEMNQRLVKNLHALYAILKGAWRKTGNTETREVLLDTCRRIGALRAAQEVFYSVQESMDTSVKRILEAICANARALFSKDVSIRYEATAGSLPKKGGSAPRNGSERTVDQCCKTRCR